MTVESWERMISINLTGTFHCLHAAIRTCSPPGDDLVDEVLGVNGGWYI